MMVSPSHENPDACNSDDEACEKSCVHLDIPHQHMFKIRMNVTGIDRHRWPNDFFGSLGQNSNGGQFIYVTLQYMQSTKISRNK